MAKPRKTEESVEALPKKPARPTRVPVSGNRDILTVSGKDPNYVYRWVNDVDGRLDKFNQAGYEPVLHDDLIKIGMRTVDASSQLGSVVTKKVGLGVTAVLMRILKEYYDEDQLTKQNAIDELEAQMREQPNREGFYGSVEIGRGRPAG